MLPPFEPHHFAPLLLAATLLALAPPTRAETETPALRVDHAPVLLDISALLDAK
ncbi:MAG: hypothetical protein L6Q75_06060 [Burkholderiaceae bacterium]|nr:hypothetical protein [Burkholderiaceae bacterium]